MQNETNLQVKPTEYLPKTNNSFEPDPFHISMRMKREGVRQLYLSRRLKMDQGYLSRILSGKVVRPDVLIRISKILDSFEAKRKRKIRAA